MKPITSLFASSLIALTLNAPAFATNVSWTDWTASSNSISAVGEIHVGSSVIDVGYSGTGVHGFVQTGSGTNYWTGNAYTQGTVENAPPAAELVALSSAGEITIVFSKPVIDPFIGLVSWNSNTVEFGQPISFDSYGQGFWGNGTPVLNSANTGFVGSGEVHGIISLKGTYESIHFTHTSEHWHGFTVGVTDIATPVPWPATFWLFGAGLLAIAPRSRKPAAGSNKYK